MHIKHIPFRKQATTFLAIIMALVYVSGIVLTDFVHPLIHQQHTLVKHTANDEQDPCHRAIYHGEKENNATHHNHLVPVNEKCWLCDIIFNYEHVKPEQPVFAALEHSSPKKFSFSSSLFFALHTLPHLRGPPALV